MVPSDSFSRRQALALVRSGQYKEAEAYIGTDESLRYFVITMMLNAKWSGSNQVSSEYRDLLARLTSDAIKDSPNRLLILDRIRFHFFPKYVREFWEIFIEQGQNLLNKNEFLTDMHSVLELHLHDLLVKIHRFRSLKKPHFELELRISFGQLVLTAALKPWHGDSVSCYLHGSADCSSHTDLFSEAVSLGLVNEAVLLHDTGSVCPKQLAALAKESNIQKMLTGNDSSPMAVFLHQVVNQPPSLKSRCRIQLARQLGDDLKGKLDRARSLGLPTSLCESLVNLHQTKQYMRSVSEEYAASVTEKETETANKNVTDAAVRELVDF